ncbi:MAG: sulfate ABC transporter substrate-binding protein [Elainellaceae cyanobacterium]
MALPNPAPRDRAAGQTSRRQTFATWLNRPLWGQVVSRRTALLTIAGVGLAGAIAACGAAVTTPDAESGTAANTAVSAGETVELTLVSYAVTQAAYEEIIPQFVEQWQAETGQTVVINQSYGGSGSQTRAVLDGLEADVVALALALDTQKLEEAGLIEPGWEQEVSNGAIVHKSVAVLVMRDGNPKNIQGWEDLARPDVSVVTANPKTSGGARWNFMALWGQLTQTGVDEATALDYVTKVYQGVPVLPRNAREATDVFYQRGQGDVLINYENEVLLAALNGEEQPYIIPDVNISIDNPIAVVDANVDKHGTREVAEAFVEFLFTPAAQREFARVGFRPVDPGVAEEFADQYPEVSTLFTVDDLNGWDAVQSKFFADGAEFDKIQAKIGQ